ncbi:MAG: diacylglycerol kinase family protein [Bacteroidota bacterium]
MEGYQREKSNIPGRLRSFIYAINGLKFTVRSQQNFRIHLAAMILVVMAGLVTHLCATEWCILILVFGLVISMEAMNTAIEQLVDLVSPDYRKQAGIVKDVAAAAVLVTAIAAVIIGIILFLPKLISINLN